MATWAATLYYMERALIADRRWAWLGMGIAFGLGILSKYTLGLLGVAALVFVVLDPASRRWLAGRTHICRRLRYCCFPRSSSGISKTAGHRFYSNPSELPGLGINFRCTCFFSHAADVDASGSSGRCPCSMAGRDHRPSPYANRRQLFVRVFTVVPLAVFFGLSLVGAPKFHWTAPVWLAVLPTIAWMMGSAGNWRNITRRVAAAWKPTIVVCLFVYAIALHYVTLGIPGVPARDSPNTTSGMKQLLKSRSWQRRFSIRLGKNLLSSA